jgi:hypothetical protein
MSEVRTNTELNSQKGNITLRCSAVALEINAQAFSPSTVAYCCHIHVEATDGNDLGSNSGKDEKAAGAS